MAQKALKNIEIKKETKKWRKKGSKKAKNSNKNEKKCQKRLFFITNVYPKQFVHFR